MGIFRSNTSCPPILPTTVRILPCNQDGENNLISDAGEKAAASGLSLFASNNVLSGRRTQSKLNKYFTSKK
jgi:hypothetical protein